MKESDVSCWLRNDLEVAILTTPLLPPTVIHTRSNSTIALRHSKLLPHLINSNTLKTLDTLSRRDTPVAINNMWSIGSVMKTKEYVFKHTLKQY